MTASPSEIPLRAGVADLREGVVRHRGGEVRSLSPTETKLLAYFAGRPGEVVSGEELLQNVWGYRPGVRSRTVYATVHRLRAKIEEDPAAPHHLLGIPRQGYVFRPLQETTADRPPPAVGATNLSAAPDVFVARVDLLERIRQALDAHPVVVLKGPGGVGKTRVSRQLGLTQLAHWPGGVWFVPLEDADSRGACLRALAQVLCVPSSRDLERRLARSLSRRGRCLVILDNLEQVVDDAGPLVEALAADAPNVRWLLTSRVTVVGAHLVPVGPLGLHRDRDLGDLKDSPAVELLVRRAAEVRPGFTADAGALRDLAAIARRVDGLPLALELAARRLDVMEPADVRRHLDSRFKLLRDRRADPGGRQSTLWATLDWSWQLLAPTEQRALACLGVLRSAFDLAAVEALLPPEPFPPDALGTLVDHSLVARVPGNDHRFRLLSDVRAFAVEKLEAVDPEPVRRAHATHFAHLGGEDSLRRSALHPESADEALAVLPDLEAAARWAIEAGESELAARCAIAMVHATTRSPPGPEEAVVAQVLRRCTPPTALRARLLLAAGWDSMALGRVDEAVDRFREVLPSGEPVLDGRAIEALASVGAARGTTDADALFAQAIDLYRSAGSDLNAGTAIANWGNVALRRGRIDLARQRYEEGLALLRSAGPATTVATFTNNLAVIELWQGRPGAAEALLDHALSLVEDGSAPRVEAMLRCTLGELLVSAERRSEGRRELAEALDLATDTEDLDLQIAALDALGAAALAEDDLLQAARHLSAAAQLLPLVGLHHAVEVHRRRAELYRRRGEVDAAAAEIAESLRIADHEGFLYVGALARCEAALQTSGAAARTLLEEARAVADEVRAGPESPLGRALIRPPR